MTPADGWQNEADDRITTDRVWSCRVGIAQLKLAVRDGEAWIWLADHSNQIGQEKILQIIGIRVKDLPPIGETLPRDKLVVLATVPGTSWTRDDVRREYEKLAKRLGPPAYLVTDGRAPPLAVVGGGRSCRKRRTSVTWRRWGRSRRMRRCRR